MHSVPMRLYVDTPSFQRRRNNAKRSGSTSAAVFFDRDDTLIVDTFHGRRRSAAVAINEARRRGRVTGTDLLSRFARSMPIDLFGMDAGALGGFEHPPQAQLHVEMPQRRVYLHPMRWTSLGHALIEAMHLGMPVVALTTTETIEAVPVDCETMSTDVERLCTALRTYRDDSERPRADGLRARAYALERYGLERFLDAWDALISKVTA